MTKSAISILVLLILFLISCQGGALQQPANNRNMKSDIKTLNEAELVGLIRTFSEDEGENGEKAFEQLRSLPRNALISDLSQLRNSLSSTDSLQPQIAFVLCYLDQDYKANAALVASALQRNPKYQNFHSDQAASLVARLIRRGDKSLLSVLFDSVQWADGALAEELGISCAIELKTDPQAFVEMLTNQPSEVRLRAYELIDRTDSFSVGDIKQLKTVLGRINTQSKSYPVAREILTSAIVK